MLTEESTSGEDGGDEGLLRGRDHVTGGMGYEICSRLSEKTKPILHCGDTRDSTSVITEEDTTEGGEGSQGDARQLVLGAGGTDAPACIWVI